MVICLSFVLGSAVMAGPPFVLWYKDQHIQVNT
jgi:hypothetical protein